MQLKHTSCFPSKQLSQGSTQSSVLEMLTYGEGIETYLIAIWIGERSVVGATVIRAHSLFQLVTRVAEDALVEVMRYARKAERVGAGLQQAKRQTYQHSQTEHSIFIL